MKWNRICTIRGFLWSMVGLIALAAFVVMTWEERALWYVYLISLGSAMSYGLWLGADLRESHWVEQEDDWRKRIHSLEDELAPHRWEELRRGVSQASNN